MMTESPTLHGPSSMIIQVIHGPNLNLLGQRDPAVYGTQTLDEINAEIQALGQKLGVTVRVFQSNHEGDIIDQVQGSIKDTQGLIINPAGLTHTSVALGDAMAVYPHPAMEVHLSNIYSREEFRHHSYVSPHVTGVLCGLGARGYLMALKFLVD